MLSPGGDELELLVMAGKGVREGLNLAFRRLR